jgi:putative transposase
MPRPLRVLAPNSVYHVTARGNRGQAIFVDESDYERFASLLDFVCVRQDWRCLAFCLMPNHVHVVVETPAADLSAGIQYLNGRYAQWFNRWHWTRGHVFQGRFHAVRIEADGHLRELLRYVALNPVRGGLCEASEDWPWSSYACVVGWRRRPRTLAVDHVLALFGREPVLALTAFRTFVDDGVR